MKNNNLTNEAMKIAKILTGTYNWEGCKGTYGTSGLKNIVQKYIKEMGLTTKVIEIKRENGTSDYFPGSGYVENKIDNPDLLTDDLF